MRAMRKKLNIRAPAPNLLHIRIENLDWCICRHCKNEVRDIDCFCCREVDVMLFASAKIPKCEGSPTFSHTCYPYLPSRCVLLFLPGVAEGNEDAG